MAASTRASALAQPVNPLVCTAPKMATSATPRPERSPTAGLPEPAPQLPRVGARRHQHPSIGHRQHASPRAQPRPVEAAALQQAVDLAIGGADRDHRQAGEPARRRQRAPSRYRPALRRAGAGSARPARSPHQRRPPSRSRRAATTPRCPPARTTPPQQQEPPRPARQTGTSPPALPAARKHLTPQVSQATHSTDAATTTLRQETRPIWPAPQ